MTPTWTLFNSYYIIFIRIYRSIFLWSDNLHESRLGITYPVAFISSPNWRTQQQKAKKRDIFAFCFEREHSWLFRDIYIYMLNTRYIYFVLLIKGSRMNHFYCLIVVFSFFFFHYRHIQRIQSKTQLWFRFRLSDRKRVSTWIDRRSDPQWARCALESALSIVSAGRRTGNRVIAQAYEQTMNVLCEFPAVKDLYIYHTYIDVCLSASSECKEN